MVTVFFAICRLLPSGFRQVCGSTVGMEQIVVEEPGRTNRSAQAWADAAQPGRLAATMPYVDSIAATSTRC